MIGSKELRKTMPSEKKFNDEVKEALCRIETAMKKAALEDKHKIVMEYKDNRFYNKIKDELIDNCYGIRILSIMPGTSVGLSSNDYDCIAVKPVEDSSKWDPTKALAISW